MLTFVNDETGRFVDNALGTLVILASTREGQLKLMLFSNKLSQEK